MKKKKRGQNQKHTKKQKKKVFLLFPKLIKCTNLKIDLLIHAFICTCMFVIRSPPYRSLPPCVLIHLYSSNFRTSIHSFYFPLSQQKII